MKRNFIITTFILIVLSSCMDGNTQRKYDNMKQEVVDTKKELVECKKELSRLKNSPELRFYNAQKLFLEGNLKGAKEEYLNILDNTIVKSDSLIIAKKIEMIDSIIKSNNRNF